MGNRHGNYSAKIKSMLKVGIDIRNIGKKRTGDEIVFFELVKNLERITRNAKCERKYDYKFLLFTDIIDREILKNIEKDLSIEGREDFKIISLKSKNKFIWNVWTLPKYLRKHPVDVYHTQYITPFFMSRRIKIITHIHDVSFRAYKKFIKRSDLFFLETLIPLSLRRADKIIAVSQFTKNEIIKYYKVKPEKIEVVYNGTSLRSANLYETTNNMQETSSPAFPLKNRERVREKYNLPEKFILYIGTLQPRKNIPMLIRAYLKIKNKIPNIKLVIAGNMEAHNVDVKIPLTPPFKRGEIDVAFPGFIDERDKMALIEMAHLFVFPSLYEGFGIPILEAMSQNVPVAASDIPSLSEVGGEAYLKFNPRDLDEIAKKLYNSCVNEELRDKLVSLGQSRIGFFSWEKSARKMLEIYKSLI